MKAATLLPTSAPPLAAARPADYLELIRPKVSLLVLFTVAAGVYLAALGSPDPGVLLHALLGTALVAAGASSLNQFLERHTDALMTRTENRPLPGGRLQPAVVLVLGTMLTITGLAYLTLTLKQPTAALVAGFTFATYVFLYTPLKRRTPLNTLVGAVPGALPPVIGWTAVRGTIDAEAIALFLIVFLWQVPHFLAIAWIYRDQYAQAGMLMLPVVDREGTRTSRQMVRYCLALIPVSLLPALLGMAGPIYIIGAVLLGLFFLRSSFGFARNSSTGQARRVLRASLVYLPALLLLLLLDGLTIGP
ncbi:MAG: heme o synthase [Gemmataceae bacterium]|nr:heme o synthase [Gemmataceae bacterium]